MLRWFVYCLIFKTSVVVSSADWDCVVGNWREWGKCSRKCDVGVERRTRNVKKNATNVFGKHCPKLYEEQLCGIKNNDCEEFCDEATGLCKCFSGYNLGIDGKSCVDVNECNSNDNKGPCTNICENFNGGYECSCPEGLYLSGDGQTCSSEKPDNTCLNDGKHVYDLNHKCVCLNGLNGPSCDRDEKRCLNSEVCSLPKLCSSYIKLPEVCVSVKQHVNILMPISSKVYAVNNFNYKVEAALASPLNNPGIVSWFKLRSIRSLPLLYVISLKALAILDNKTLITFGVIDTEKGNFVDANEVCQKLQYTDLKCFSQQGCIILKQQALECPPIYYPKIYEGDSGRSKSVVWYSVLIVVIILVALALFLFCFLRRKRKRRNKFVSTRLNLRSDVEIDQSNILYGQEDPADSAPLYESIDNITACLDSDQYMVMKGACAGGNNSIMSHDDQPVDKYEKKELTVDLSKDKEKTIENEDRYVLPPSLTH